MCSVINGEANKPTTLTLTSNQALSEIKQQDQHKACHLPVHVDVTFGTPTLYAVRKRRRLNTPSGHAAVVRRQVCCTHAAQLTVGRVREVDDTSKLASGHQGLTSCYYSRVYTECMLVCLLSILRYRPACRQQNSLHFSLNMVIAPRADSTPDR